MAVERTTPVHRQPVNVHPVRTVRPHREGVPRAPEPAETDIAVVPTAELRHTPTPETLPQIPKEAEQIRILDRDEEHTLYEIEAPRNRRHEFGYTLLNADVDSSGMVMLTHVNVGRTWTTDPFMMRAADIKRLYWDVVEAENYYRDHRAGGKR